MKTNDHAVRCDGILKHFGDGEARVDVLRGVQFEARLGERGRRRVDVALDQLGEMP